MMVQIEVRKGMPDVQLTREEFERRFRDRFFDPAFSKREGALKGIIGTAWDGYCVYRKNPIKGIAIRSPQLNFRLNGWQPRGKSTPPKRTRKSRSHPAAFCLSMARCALTRVAPVKCQSLGGY
jgi:hypothetical protein